MDALNVTGPLVAKAFTDKAGQRQFTVENEDRTALYEHRKWEELYVSFSGFSGAHNPQVFAAAPELLEALEELMIAVEKATNTTTAGEEQVALIELLAPARKSRAVIAKAKGGR